MFMLKMGGTYFVYVIKWVGLILLKLIMLTMTMKKMFIILVNMFLKENILIANIRVMLPYELVRSCEISYKADSLDSCCGSRKSMWLYVQDA